MAFLPLSISIPHKPALLVPTLDKSDDGGPFLVS